MIMENHAYWNHVKQKLYIYHMHELLIKYKKNLFSYLETFDTFLRIYQKAFKKHTLIQDPIT